MTPNPYSPPTGELPPPPVVMEERPVLLLIVMLLYFLNGCQALLGAVVGLFLGAGLTAVVLQAAYGAFAMSSTYGAWRHHRLGYVGVLLFGLGFAASRAYAAYALDWADVPTNLMAILSLALVAPLFIYRRLYLRARETA